MLFCVYHVAINDKQKVKAELGHFTAWNDLGLNLGLSPDVLGEIKEDETRVKKRVDAVLEHWLRNNVLDKAIKPTWAQLVAAVEPIDYALSENIKKNHPC